MAEDLVEIDVVAELPTFAVAPRRIVVFDLLVPSPDVFPHLPAGVPILPIPVVLRPVAVAAVH